MCIRDRYTIAQIERVKHLKPKFSEYGNVSKLSYHFQRDIQLGVYTQGIKTIEEFLILVTQSENISKGKNTQHWEPKHTNHHYNYHRDDKTSIQNATQNRDNNYKINYTPPIHNTTTRTATETERMNTAKQRGEGHQVMKTELHLSLIHI